MNDVKNLLDEKQWENAKRRALWLLGQDTGKPLSKQDAATLLQAIALAEKNLGNIDASLTLMEQALARSYHINMGLKDMGDILHASNRPAEARRFYENAFALFPKETTILLSIAACAKEDGDEAAAAEVINRYHRLCSNDSNPDGKSYCSKTETP